MKITGMAIAGVGYGLCGVFMVWQGDVLVWWGQNRHTPIFGGWGFYVV